MKRLSAAQIQNIVFTAIVAIAAVALYLLAGRGNQLAGSVASPSPEPTPEPALYYAPVPEDVFTLRVTDSDAFRAGRRREEPLAYNLVCGDTYTGTAVLTYTIAEDGCISAFALRFPCPDEPNEKPKTNADKVYADLYPAYIARQNKAVETMLRELLTIADVNDVFSEPVLLRWYTGAINARDYKKYYTETYERCEFQAYPSQWGEERVVICSFMQK